MAVADGAEPLGVVVRKAGPEDVDRVVALNRFVQRIHADARPDVFRRPDDMPGIVDHYRALLREGAKTILLAEVEGGAVGYVVFEIQRRPSTPFTHALDRLYVDQLSVDPSFRRRGVASALMERVVDEARRIGIDVVALDTWNFNEEAQRFFHRVGFATYNLRMERTL